MTTRRDFLRGTAASLAALAAARAAFAERLNAPMPSPGTNDWRAKYTLDPEITYLNHGSIGTIPKAVQEAHVRYLQTCERNPALYVWGQEWEDLREQVRGKLAACLHCQPDEVVINHNTTEGFNLLAQGLDLEAGDEVLFSSLNHIGASRCFQQFAEHRGFRVRRFEFPHERTPELTEGQVVELHVAQIRPETRLLVLPHMDNFVGLRHPVKEIAAAARELGVEYVAADGAQTVAMIPVNVRDLGVDFYCASPHKWLQSPKGLGVMYMKKERLANLRPIWVTWGQDRWRDTVRVYEDYGTRDLPEVLALGDAVDFQAKVSWDDRLAHYRSLRQRAGELTERHPRVRWHSPSPWELGGSLYSVFVPGADSKQLSAQLDGRGFVLRPFPTDDGTWLRISPNLVNTVEEIEALFAVL